MDLFLLHCVVLTWTSLGSARRLVRPAADQLLAATMLARGNVVATSLLLSRLHRLDDPLWFLGTSAAIAGLICSVLFRVRPAPIPSVSPVSAKASRINPWLLGAFSLVTAALALGSIAVASTYQPSSPDALAYHLPRVMYYLGQGSLAHFLAPDLRQVYLPFNYNLLQLFCLVYSPPFQCLNFFNLLAWAITGIAAYRLCRLIDFSPNASLIACGLTLISPPIIAQSTSTTDSLAAGSALLCALVFGLRWLATRTTQDALLAGLALGLSVGSKLSILCFAPAAIGLWIAWYRHRPSSPFPDGSRALIWSAGLTAAVATPFAMINLADGNATVAAGNFFLGRALPFEGFGKAARVLFVGLTDYPFASELSEITLGYGSTGVMVLIGALFCVTQARKGGNRASFYAGLGLGWIACYFLGQSPEFKPVDFVPAMLVMTPCVAAIVAAVSEQRTLRQYAAGSLILLVALASLWTSGDYMLHNPSRPLAPFLNGDPAPPALPELPLLLERHLTGQTRFNIDTESPDENIFLLMARTHGQRFTSRPLVDPKAYNILSRGNQSRNAAFSDASQRSTYVLVPIPSKTTEGVEFLATIDSDTAARDYYGIGPKAGQMRPIEANRMVLLTLYHEPRQSDRAMRTRIKLEGLNPEDQARLSVDLVYDNRKTDHVASFDADGECTVALSQPFHHLTFSALDRKTGATLGSAGLLYQPLMPRVGINANRSSNPRTLFATDLIIGPEAKAVKVEGLLPVEGPFPQWDLPCLRWARQPTVTIKISPLRQLAKLQVSFSTRLHVRGRGDLIVALNGRIIRQYKLEDKLKWLDDTLELTAQPGENVLEFRDATFKSKPDWIDYLKRYPDVKDYLVANKLPLEQGAKDHYEAKGKMEGRTVRLVPTSEPEPAYESYYFMYRNIKVEGFRSPGGG